MTTPDAIKSVVRKRHDVPSEERARELIDQNDPHTDPDAPTAIPDTSEAEIEAAPEWRVAKALLVLRDQVNRKAPNRDKSSDGHDRR